AAEREQQVEQADADRDVNHRYRLVRHDHLRVDRERARDRDTLALSARKLMWIFGDEVVRWREVDPLEELADRGEGLAAAACLLVSIDRGRERLEDRARRIECGIGILADTLHRRPEEGESGA